MKWRLDPFPESTTLGSRLVVLFSLGSALLLSAVGYWLYHALQMQLDERELAEIHGKTEIIEHVLSNIPSAEALPARLDRLRDIPLGHPHLTIGLNSNGHWLLPLPAVLSDSAALAAQITRLEPGKVRHLQRGESSWWVKRIRYTWSRNAPAAIDVFLVIDVSESRQILREHGWSAVLAVVLGSLASGLLAFFVARQGLAPIAQIATEAEQMTSAKLGAPIDIAHAPGEIRQLVASLNRMLERLGDSFRSLEQFSADIAHELRTPLNNLMLQTQVTLSRPRQADEYEEALLGNLEQLEQLQRMVSDMLFLARADRGMIHLNRVTVDLHAEAQQLAEFFELAASERHQRIGVCGQACVSGDRAMLRRAMTNLLSNAVRYAPDHAKIELTLEETEHGAVLSVSNPGEPIPAERLSQLFSRFTRNDDARSRDTDGVGLGLAIVDSIMRLHQGQVVAVSDQEKVQFQLRFQKGLDTAATHQASRV